MPWYTVLRFNSASSSLFLLAQLAGTNFEANAKKAPKQKASRQARVWCSKCVDLCAKELAHFIRSRVE